MCTQCTVSGQFSSHDDWLSFWVGKHSDAYHPGTRDDCPHCQIMIEAFGPMPLPAEIHNYEFQQRRAKRTHHRKTIGNMLRKQVFERDAYRCLECGSWKDLTLDHIIPVSRGGADTLDNLRSLCAPCNSRKGARV
jgi:hypothetical protein